MNSLKKVSIVLPVYNGEKYLSESLDSIIAQTYQNIEIIAVNDCSTDRTREILRAYSEKDNRLIILDNETNLKLPRSLNVGFAHSQGDYLTWTSDDNIYAPTAIERMVCELESHPDVSMVYANYQRIDSEGKMIKGKVQSDFCVFSRANIIGACFLYTRKVMEQVGDYDPSMFLVEDYDYWIRIAKCGEIRHIDEIFYYYRIHNNSLGQSKREEVAHMTYLLQKKHFLFLQSLCKTQKEQFLLYDKLFQYTDAVGDPELWKYVYSVSKIYFVRKLYLNLKNRCLKYKEVLLKKLKKFFKNQ